MDGLIIKPCWLKKILSHEKIIEVRGNATKKTGEEIYLIESKGKVKGIAVIKSVFPFDEISWEDLRSAHKVDITFEELLKRYKTPYGWCLEDVQEVTPFDYEKHQGAVIWVKNVKKI